MIHPSHPGTHRARHRCRRTAALPALLALVLATLGGCLYSQPIAPRPSVVYVPRPGQVPDSLSAEEVKTLYTASPNRNPDGLGVLDTIWLQSRMTLMVWPIEREREALNRIAYDRTEAEQRQIVAERKAFFSRYVVFKGLLVGDTKDATDPETYMPEGVYLVDDQGHRFRPVWVNEGIRQYDRMIRVERAMAHSFRVSAAGTVWGYPYVVFPAEAIGPKTRAVTLYFAAAQRRLSFTWVFDPDYTPPQRHVDIPGREPGAHRLFPARSAPTY